MTEYMKRPIIPLPLNSEAGWYVDLGQDNSRAKAAKAFAPEEKYRKPNRAERRHSLATHPMRRIRKVTLGRWRRTNVLRYHFPFATKEQ